MKVIITNRISFYVRKKDVVFTDIRGLKRLVDNVYISEIKFKYKMKLQDLIELKNIFESKSIKVEQIKTNLIPEQECIFKKCNVSN